MKVVAYVVFVNCADAHTNVDEAARELEQAGFEVHRLPAELVETLDVESDDFIEVRGEVSDAELMRDKVAAIVSKHGGDAYEWGPVAPEYTPFARFDWPA
jgi:hypothetical protein